MDVKDRISRTERLTNERALLRRVTENSCLLTVARQKQKSLGHIMRGESLMRDVIEVE